MTYWIRPLVQHLQMGMGDGPIPNPYPQDSYAGLMWTAGNAYTNGTPAQAFEALSAAGEILHQTNKRMPDIEDLATKIGIPFKDWTGNCALIANAVLPHLDLDMALSAYGFYTGEIAPGTHFSSHPIVRHGWIETLDGLVIDPTRWVFEGREPELFVGGITDYDYGMMRFKENTPFPEPMTKTATVTFEPEQTAFVSGITGIEAKDNTITMAINQFSWLADRPLQTLREHFMPIIDALDEQGAGWITQDAVVWRNANRPITNEKAAAAA